MVHKMYGHFFLKRIINLHSNSSSFTPSIRCTPNSHLCSALGVLQSLLLSEPIPEQHAGVVPPDWSKECHKAGPSY